MKKLLVPIVALLAFSMLCTSVSAPNGLYAVRFYGSANGECRVDVGVGISYGRGRARTSGLVTAAEPVDTGPHWADRILRLRSQMKVSWENKKLMVYMWPSDVVWAWFRDDLELFRFRFLNFSGYYIEDSAVPQYIKGTAEVWIWDTTTGLVFEVDLWIGAELWTFLWGFGDPRGWIWSRVTAWPIFFVPS